MVASGNRTIHYLMDLEVLYAELYACDIAVVQTYSIFFCYNVLNSKKKILKKILKRSEKIMCTLRKYV